jgi:predicted RNA-binding Zn-ribbon protein involved in translation (DUF1610 family)
MLDLYAKNPTAVYAIVVAAFLTFAVCRAFLGCWLASEKGRPLLKWFLLCFFLGIPALLALGFAPSNNAQKTMSQKTEPHDMSVKWKCPKCGAENANDSYACKGCGYRLA